MEQLDALLAALEQSPPVEALKTSFIVYPLVNVVHVLAIGALVTCVVLMDLRILGFLRKAEPGMPIPLLRRIALSAFAVAALTGLTMFSIRATEYVANPAFLAKMTLIPVAALNFLVFLRFAGRGGERADPYPAPVAARFGAALSILLWLAIAVLGRFIGFV